MLTPDHNSPGSPPCRFGQGWRWLGWCGIVLAGWGALPLRAEVSKEYQLKAAFLFNFTRFIEWPADRFTGEGSPIVIGVFGHNPFDVELENMVKGRTVNGRTLVVRSVATAEAARSVHLLFVPAGEENRLPLAAWQGLAIVAVGESDAFAASGGTITFMTQGDKVRFNINLATAERDHVKISAQLLKLAAVVRRKS